MSNEALYAAHSESVLIGSILVRGRDGLDEAKAIIAENDLYLSVSQLIFRTCERLADACTEIAPDTILAELIRTHEVGELGQNAGAYLVEVRDTAGVGMHIEYHARLIAEASRRRAVIRIAGELNRDATEVVGPVSDLTAKAYAELFALENEREHEPRLFADVLGELIEDLNQKSRPDYQSELIRTGLRTFDFQCGGGLAPGELVILAARPGRGKTAMLLQWARSFADFENRPLLFSLEMRDKENAARILAAESQADSRLFRGQRCLEQYDAANIMNAYHRLRSGPPAWIDDKPDCTATRISSTARRYARKHKTRVVLVDYLQLIRPMNAKEPRHQQVGQAARDLKILARNQGIVVVCAAQLNREIEGRPDTTPRLSDLRDSGEIEQHADFVFFLHGNAESQHQPEENIDLICGKGRSVSAGYRLPLKWNKPRMTFTEAISGID